ncbi:MAG: hydroxyacid dehydrogenase [Chloroflexota bacterium]
MSLWKILLTDGLEESGKAILRAAAQLDDLRGISPEELINIIPAYHAMIVRGRTKVTAAIIQAAEQLKVIGRAGVGVDNIDLAAATSHNISVVNSPTSTTNAVAELTLGLMIALARDIPRADISMKHGQWLKKDLMGYELRGKTLGIIGLGRIGSTVSKMAVALGMTVLANDPLLSIEEIRQRGAEPVELVELYNRSDYISLHVPLSPNTRVLVNGQAFASMKRGVRIICTARGGIVDETALLGALESNQVAGAALDVFALEPPGLSALVAHPNVIATPHIGAQTFEAQSRAAQDIADEVLAALQGQPLRWKIV